MADSANEFLVFCIAGQRYGLPIAQVVEIVRSVSITPLPKAPAIVEGIINLRGKPVPVFDFRARCRLPAKPLDTFDHFIVARAGSRLAVLRVDRAVELVQTAQTPMAVDGVVPGAEYVRWIATFPEDLLLIHDLETFLSRNEVVELDEALDHASELIGDKKVHEA